MTTYDQWKTTEPDDGCEDTRLVSCEACDGSGGGYGSGYAYPCECCHGTGLEEIEVEPVTLDDLMECEQ